MQLLSVNMHRTSMTYTHQLMHGMDKLVLCYNAMRLRLSTKIGLSGQLFQDISFFFNSVFKTERHVSESSFQKLSHSMKKLAN